MTTFVDIAVRTLPELARLVVGDTNQQVLRAISQAFRDVFGAKDAPQVEQDIRADPNKLTEVRMKLAEIAVRADKERRDAEIEQMRQAFQDAQGQRDATLSDLRLRLEDIAGAWQAAAGYAGAGGPMSWGPLMVSGVVLAAFVVLLGYMVRNASDMTALNDAQLFNITFGALTAAFATVVSFWLGSSQGSRNKDAASFELQQTADAARAKSAQDEMALRKEAAATAGAANVNAKPLETSRFGVCVGLILQKEGGYVDHPADKGGPTNHGITHKTLAAWRGKEVSAEDVKALQPEEAKEIYFANYWNALRCESLPAGLDLVVFDFGVNAGVSRAARTLQKCVAVADDGVIGPITLGAVEKFAPDEVVRRFGQERMKFYEGLDNFNVFGKGWRSRTEAVETVALNMARAKPMAA